MNSNNSSLSSQELEEHFDLLATDAKEYAVFVIGLDGKLLCWNAGAEQIFGYHSPEVIGQHFSRFFSPDDIVTGKPEHELQTASATGRCDGTCWQVRKDGTRLWCRATVTLLLDDKKQGRSFARVVHDLTESEALADQRKRADGLTVNREGEEAVIRVRDNGVGIAPELLPQIFELFTQVDGSLGRSYGGLGIGLALARNLVEMHDGRLQASSAGLGKGCEFTIKLPLLAALSASKSKTVLEPGNGNGPPLQVLVVEDNVDTADSLSLLLRLYGHQVQVARTGRAALDLAFASLPDVVLLDIGLPDMDGYQVAKLMREEPNFKDVTICALTGYTPSEADRQRQQETGFNHYYVKPMNLAKLLELFKTVTPLESSRRLP
jgi:PAS domain S-box-containing protein